MIGRCLALSLALAAAACTSMPPPGSFTPQAGTGCHSHEVQIAFDFEGAPPLRCTVEGEREFALLVTPEHAPPINPSPWYAFRYRASGSEPVSVRIDYMGAKHRYAPKLTEAGETRTLPVEVSDDRMHAVLALPPGEGTVSGQPIVASRKYEELIRKLSDGPMAQRLVLGRSLDGRPIDAVRIGDPDAPRLVVLLGRQHPPEVTGSYALAPFVEEIARQLRQSNELAAQYQVLIVPLLNPDGVARGHWRANRGGVDLNRDWGKFTQPETRAVAQWLDALGGSVELAAMIDFHSTWRNLFYVQGEEASPAQRQFLSRWLVGKENAFPGYPFTIERSNANPGSGTSKNWFHARYGIPAYTYEVADDANPESTASAAKSLAATFLPALDPSD